MNYARRRDRLRAAIKQAGCEAMLVTSELNVGYLTGFGGDSSYLLVHGKGELMLTDSRYETQIQEECPGLGFESRTSRVPMLELLEKIVGSHRFKSLMVEGDSLTLNQFASFEQKLSQTTLVASSAIVEQLRMIKDKDELQEIRRSIRLAERAFEATRATLTPEHTERLIAAELEHRIRLFGGTGCAFKPIVGVGPRAALPHAIPTDRKVEESPFVLIDWGAKAGRYMSDLTRVLVTGKAPAKLAKIYSIVLQAQLAAIAKIAPGVSASEVDHAARSVIEQAGHGKHFGHGLGHGFGLQIHEEPRMSGSNTTVLEPGMIVTVEPGIYLPGWGGVRIEDDVLVTGDGHEVLTSVPKEYDAMEVRW